MAELDRRDGDAAARPAAQRQAIAADEDASNEAPALKRRPLAWLGAVWTQSPVWRAAAITVSVGVPVIVIGVMLSGATPPAQVASGPPPRAVIAAGTAAPQGGVLPVPVQPAPPRAVADLPPQPPTIIDTSPPPVRRPVTAYAPPPPRESWLRRVLRSGRASSPFEYERVNQ